MAEASVYRIMTVCTGNICRSPMAEVVLRDRLEAAGLADAVTVDSTGVSDEEEGNRMDQRAVAVLEDHGYAVPRHRARRVTKSELESRDLVLVMTVGHAQRLRRLRPDAPISLYRSFDLAAVVEARGDEHRLDIDDPWYGGRDDFEEVLGQLESGADAIVAHVREALGR
ncbi:low molecular weight protein-tyrosine-phosphatase [Demequina sp. SYSU T00039]|uniref:protein-tyrosine-phosphatase n=1 Tax=Demequina lignilytica TaxID=3051663 RepID=A0AAW7M4P0_9MICO|nr:MULTISPECIES: low molecular weight protein-tyrosine-phosphatase [unclassified Demequina]MDN4477758.1 low molecular weight protein-tyrosine-phosphatase [Demequina sp. SYSU T00039-1]MDN4487667.1 low molecular weight protein-tyrosine-phosphatase [Demequina sp. SYSU T00039]MDN4491378.1 low molecular weight protein-tyrosine-phosphatase [Demequina sp. SYSU T00068]